MSYAVLFPGQGSQYIGMCNQLLKDHTVAKNIFQEAGDVLGIDLQKMIEKGSMKELTKSKNAQPSVVAASYALFRVFQKEVGISPDFAVGHSLGEISALIAANACSFSKGIQYVSKRGTLMDRAVKDNKGGAGIVVDIEESLLDKLVTEIGQQYPVCISGYNSPRQFIIAGSREGIGLLENKVEKAGGQLIPFRMIPMKADAPYHSQQMDYLKIELEEELKKIPFKNPDFCIWSTVTGDLIRDASSISAVLGKQLTTPVYWNQVLKKVNHGGVDLFIDIGPGDTIKNLVSENSELSSAFAFDKEEERSLIINKLKQGMMAKEMSLSK